MPDFDDIAGNEITSLSTDDRVFVKRATAATGQKAKWIKGTNVLITTPFLGEAGLTTNPGTPSSPVYYYASVAGTYTNFKDASNASIVVTSGDISSNKVRLSVNGAVTTKVLEPSTVLAIVDNVTTNDGTKALSAAQGFSINNQVNGIAEVTESYPIDFTPLTSTGGANNLYSNAVPIATAGKLKNVRIKTTVGSTVTVKVYTVVFSGGTYTYTLLHSYTTWVTAAAEETHTFSDSYTVPVGAFIFVKSNGNINYTSLSGGYYINEGTSTLTVAGVKVSHDFVISTVSPFTGVTQRITTNETALSTLNTKVDGIPAVSTSYPVDFTTLTSIGGVNNIYSNAAAVTNAGKLGSARVKAVIGSVIEVSVYTVSGSAYTLLHTYTTWVTAATEETHTFTDSYVIPVGAFLFFKSTQNIYYVAASGGYRIDTGTSTAVTSGVKVGFDFIINTSDAIIGVTDKTATNAANISTLQSQVASLQVTIPVVLKPAILFRSYLTDLTGFSAVGWSSDGSGAIPAGIDSGNYLWLNKRFHVNPKAISIDITLLSDNIFYIDCYPIDYIFSGGVFAVDMTTSKLVVYDRMSGLGGGLTQAAIDTIPFTLVSGRKYNLNLELRDWVNTFTIKDTVTGSSFTLTYNVGMTSFTGQNLQSDSYRFYIKQGSTSGVKIHRIIVASKLKPLIMLMGDSITHGVYFNSVNYPSTYGMLLKSALRGNLIISARGGDTLAQGPTDKLATEVPFVKPDYLMCTIGTNAGLGSTALTNFVNAVFALGVTPIINHIPNRGDNNVHLTANPVIDAVCAATGAIRGALFDIATSTNNDPTQAYVSSLYVDAGVHPNAAGHQAMYNRFAIDIPFLFV